MTELQWRKLIQNVVFAIQLGMTIAMIIIIILVESVRAVFIGFIPIFIGIALIPIIMRFMIWLQDNRRVIKHLEQLQKEREEK